ncbi:hypothetical protein [Funiculus sociatus]|nr:hypothetical protein [Trichocoleus sp. FACHB-69]
MINSVFQVLATFEEMSSALPPLKAPEVAGKVGLLESLQLTGGQQNAIAALRNCRLQELSDRLRASLPV